MRKVLIAVDDTKNSMAAIAAFKNMVSRPEELILLHVERLAGSSLIIDMLGDAEMETLKEMMKGTDYKNELDLRAEKLLAYCKNEVGGGADLAVRTIKREGVPAEEILKVAREEHVDLIVMGYCGRKGLNRVVTGDVFRKVERDAGMPVLAAKRHMTPEESRSLGETYTAFSLWIFTAIALGIFVLGFLLQTGLDLP